MRKILRLLPVLALAAFGARPSQAVPANASVTLIYEAQYNQGRLDGTAFIGDVNDTSQAHFDSVQAEKLRAEDQRDNHSTSPANYYYLSGYIDRLDQFTNNGG